MVKGTVIHHHGGKALICAQNLVGTTLCSRLWKLSTAPTGQVPTGLTSVAEFTGKERKHFARYRVQRSALDAKNRKHTAMHHKSHPVQPAKAHEKLNIRPLANLQNRAMVPPPLRLLCEGAYYARGGGGACEGTYYAGGWGAVPNMATGLGVD